MAGNPGSSAGSGTAAAAGSVNPLVLGQAVVPGYSTGRSSTARIAVGCPGRYYCSSSAGPEGVHGPVRCWLTAEFQWTAGIGHWAGLENGQPFPCCQNYSGLMCHWVLVTAVDAPSVCHRDSQSRKPHVLWVSYAYQHSCLPDRFGLEERSAGPAAVRLKLAAAD